MFPALHIPKEGGQPYLSRYRLIGGGAGSGSKSLYLHELRSADEDLHSHPWAWFLSVILRGGYVEERDGALRTFRPGSVNFMRHGDEHRIVKLLGPTTTLVLAGASKTTWHFRVNGKTVPWRRRLRQRGLNPRSMLWA